MQGNGFTAGEVILNVSDLSVMEVNVEVNESDIVRIHLGDEAEIEVDAYLGETFKGEVTEIGNTALNAGMNGFSMDQVTNFSVKVRIAQRELRPPHRRCKRHAIPTWDECDRGHLDCTCRRRLSAPIQAVTSRNAGFGAEEGEDGNVSLGRWRNGARGVCA